MADFPYQHGAKYATYGVDTATSLATSMTSGAANTKGSYVTIASATDFPAVGIIVQFASPNISSRFLVDIAIGAASSEVIIIPDLTGRAETGRVLSWQYYFPIGIPPGVRIAARCQSEDATVSLRVAVTIVGGGFASQAPYSKVLAIGADTTTTDGTVISLEPLADNTKSSYAELVASLSAPVKAIMVVSTSFTFTGTPGMLIDIALGGAGSEVVLIPNLAFSGDNGSAIEMSGTGFFPCSIPAGTRISYRAQASTTPASNFAVFTLYGLV